MRRFQCSGRTVWGTMQIQCESHALHHGNHWATLPMGTASWGGLRGGSAWCLLKGHRGPGGQRSPENCLRCGLNVGRHRRLGVVR